MRLSDELLLAAPLQRTWPLLLDVRRVAQALPGASIDAEPVQGEFRGQMKVKLGPVTVQYSGVAAVQDIDDDEHVASYRVSGREARGQGTAEATITVRARAHGTATRLWVDTDLDITGRQAQLGRGIMEEVASAVLSEFAARLERAILNADGADGRADGGASNGAGDRGPGDEEVFDAGAAVYRPLLERAAFLLAGVAAGLALGRAVWRR